MAEHFPNKHLLDQLINGEISPEDYSGDSDLKRVLELGSRMETPAGLSQEEAWNKLSANITENPAPIRSRILSFPSWSIAIAAGLALLCGLWVFLPDSEVIHETQRGEKVAFNLPDGSSVNLNAESHIHFAPGDWEEQRSLILEGEAFFKVEKGETFTVETPIGSVTVLGTSFNVFAREERFEVACMTGKVNVSIPDQEATVLLPGEAIRINNAGISVPFQFEEKAPNSWQKGEFYFENAPINHVIAVMQRQFDVQIESPDLNGRAYTGYFTNQNLEEALQLVCIPLGLRYTVVSSAHIRLGDAATDD